MESILYDIPLLTSAQTEYIQPYKYKMLFGGIDNQFYKSVNRKLLFAIEVLVAWGGGVYGIMLAVPNPQSYTASHPYINTVYDSRCNIPIFLPVKKTPCHRTFASLLSRLQELPFGR